MNSQQFSIVSRAIQALLDSNRTQLSLEQLAKEVGLSPFHLQRLFRESVGITPKEFTSVLNISKAKKLLVQKSILDTTIELGLSSPSRMHDLFLKLDNITPGEFRNGGSRLDINWNCCETPFGTALVATCHRGVCRISFVDSEETAELELRREWPEAKLNKNPDSINEIVEELVRRMEGQNPKTRISVLLKGSPLRLKVWEALIRIPIGSVVSYQNVAELAFEPKAVRAVASAIADNEIAFLIPCHRVIRSTGEIGQYRWAPERKTAMIVRESIA